MNSNPSLTIGELARRTGRSVHAIRWYESTGLLPAVQRNPGNRRVFDQRHVEWLELMERLQLTGMSTKEMRAYVAMAVQGRKTLSQRRDLLQAHRQRVLETIAQWQEALALLQQKIGFYNNWISTGRAPDRITTPAHAGPTRRIRKR
jgi:DNA-binding transcriptional MerR regulator